MRESSESVEVFITEGIDYTDYIAWQTERVRARVADEVADCVSVVTFSESVYTIPVVDEPTFLNIDDLVVSAQRGGDDSWHGPGQIIISPVMRLERPIRITEFTNALEYPARQALADYGITPDEHDVGADDDFPGIAVGGKKIAQVGIHFVEGVSSYGIAFNVNCDLSKFDAIDLCGIENCPVTSLAVEANREVVLEDVIDLLASYIKTAFDGEDMRNGAEN